MPRLVKRVISRMDRPATLYLFHPLNRMTNALYARRRVPILMYHSLSTQPRIPHPYYETVTHPTVFDAHIRFLAENGYRSIGISEAARYLSGELEFPQKAVAITFDDGYRDFYEHGMPVLKRYGFKATMFVTTSFVGDQRVSFRDVECMTWSEIREVHSAGIDIGSHTVTHPKLHLIETKRIGPELRDSKAALEDRLGSSVDTFSYPFAFPEHNLPFRNMLTSLMQEQGYRAGVSTILGTAGEDDSPLFLKRVPVNSYDDSRLLKAKLEGGYNWLHGVQYTAKSMGVRLKGLIVE